MSDDSNERDQARSHEQEVPADGGTPTSSFEPQQPRPRQRGAGGKALSDALRISFVGLQLLMVILIGFYLQQGCFEAERNEVVIKLRFGRPVQVKLDDSGARGYVMDAESGWHFRWPWETLERIRTDEQTLNMVTDFWPISPPDDLMQKPEELRGLDVRLDRCLLTGDGNVMHAMLRVRYQVRADEDALAYRFGFGGVAGSDKPDLTPTELLRRFVAEAAVETAASWTAMDVRRKRHDRTGQGLFEAIEAKTREKLNLFERQGLSLGIQLNGIEGIEDPRAPDKVEPLFNQAEEAKHNVNLAVQKAKQQAEDIVRRAEAEALDITNAAEQYASDVAKASAAEADRFTKLLPAYRSPKTAAILREWHLQRAVALLMGESVDTFVIHGPREGAKLKVHIMMSRPPKKQKDDTKRPQEGEEGAAPGAGR